jgi:hypothetical protein
MQLLQLLRACEQPNRHNVTILHNCTAASYFLSACAASAALHNALQMGPPAVAGLVSRLLLLEAVQQPVQHSLLNPAICHLWQQQQHLDLANAARSSSSSSSNANGTCSDASSSSIGWLPQLAATLLQPLLLPNASVSESAAARQVASITWPEHGSHGAAAAAAAAQQLDGVGSYVLACVSSPGCRYSLTCWVLAWHAALLQQAGDCSSAADR